MIRDRADSFGCLTIAFIAAFFVSYVLLGFASMGDLADERMRLPLWQGAARVMTVCFGGALALSTFLAAPAHRIPVFLTGLVVAVSVYFIAGLLWWFYL
jgi:hypothetical protein